MTIFIFWRCRSCLVAGRKAAVRLHPLTVPNSCSCGSRELIYKSTPREIEPDWFEGEIPPPRPTTPIERGELLCHRIDPQTQDCVVCGCPATRECSGTPANDWDRKAVADGVADYYNYRWQWPA